MINSQSELNRILDELSVFNFIRSPTDRESLVSTVDLMIDILNNQYFNENSENAMDDPDNIEAIRMLKDGHEVLDGEYLSESIDALVMYFDCAEEQQVWGDTPWKELLGWSA